MSNISQLRQADVDLNGLMSVLSKHLYSTPMVAVRELVQNAHDSIIRRQLEDPDDTWQASSRIDVIADSTQHTLRIIDTGAGLTEEEIHKYLATVGTGYTRKLREENKSDELTCDDTGLIGMFGLGFLSAFVLAKKVTVTTTSYQTPTLAHRYVSTNAKHYTVSQVPARSIGTEVLIELNDDHLDLDNVHKLRQILSHYCALLSQPIFISSDDTHSDTAINPEPPPWRNDKLRGQQAQKSALAFATRFEKNFEPICTFTINHDDIKGLLWIQDGATYGTSDNRNLSVFVRGMLLDDNARDLLPAWAGFVGGVIESNLLTPTASREDLQKDEAYYHAQYALSEALIEGLAHIASTQPENWRRVLRRHNEALLGASLCDERLMTLLMDSLHVTTSYGALPVLKLIHKGSLHSILDSSSSFEAMLFKALGIPVAEGNRYAVVPFLRRYASMRGLKMIELGTKSGNKALFSEKALDKELHAWLKDLLCDKESLVVASFAPDSLPLIVVPDREQALKKRLEDDEQDKKISQAALRLARSFTATIKEDAPARLYLNIDNKAVQKLIALYEQGQADPKTIADGVALLKSIKTLLFNQGEHSDSQSLMTALTTLDNSVQALLP